MLDFIAFGLVLREHIIAGTADLMTGRQNRKRGTEVPGSPSRAHPQ